jgi:hypothetical protein
LVRIRSRTTWVGSRLALVIVAMQLETGAWPVVSAPVTAAAQPQERHVTIPYLANDSKPRDLDFAAAECDIDADGGRMTCRFRQVFVTLASHDPTACVITSNGYELSFDKAAATRWVSIGVPEGACGVVETTTLEDGGGTRWTMTIRRAATGDADRDECRARPVESEVYSWRDVKRALPCTTIQPGAIER